MEQNQNTSLFGLSIDPMTRNHLAEAARWAKFLAIMGFIMCGLIVVIGIFAGSFFSMFADEGYGRYRDVDVDAKGLGAVMAVVYVLLALLYFFPCLFLFNFAAKMKTALNAQNQELLNSSFQNLKKCFRYVGVLTIIILCLYVLALLGALLGSR
ncbi:MAG: hypothetical protein JNK14_01095 [Chitinophagaceae bacterium]|nr:hypothetical protein [Chitinophagaceae bacterium]